MFEEKGEEKYKRQPIKKRSYNEICDIKAPKVSKLTEEEVKIYEKLQETKFSDYKFDFPDEKRTLYTSKLLLATHCKHFKVLFEGEDDDDIVPQSGESLPRTPCKYHIVALAILHQIDITLTPESAYGAYKLFTEWECPLGLKVCKKPSEVNPEMMLKFPKLYEKNLHMTEYINGFVPECPIARYCIDCVIKNLRSRIGVYKYEAFDDEIKNWGSSLPITSDNRNSENENDNNDSNSDNDAA